MANRVNDGSRGEPPLHGRGVSAEGARDAGRAPAELFRAIESEFSVALGSPERVAAACSLLAGIVAASSLSEPWILRLIPLLQRRAGAIARPLGDFLVSTARSSEDPHPIVEGLVQARDRGIANQGLDLALELARDGRFAADLDAIRLLARLVDTEGSPFEEHSALEAISRIVLNGEVGGETVGAGPLVTLYLGGEGLSLRRLAARLLDRSGAAVPPSRAERLLGTDAHRFLRPYIDYARGTHRDLLDLAPCGPLAPRVLESLKRAEVRCGETLLRSLIAQIGWSRLNLGIEVHEHVPVSIGGSFPLLVPPAVAPLLDGLASVRRSPKRMLIVAHGGAPADEGTGGVEDDRIARFRSYNLTHADVLAELLDVAPLTSARVGGIVERMDRIVADFVTLFAPYDDECTVLPVMYQALRGPILAGAAGVESEAPLPPDTMRLAQAFEDPVSLGDVHSLHGLKRYLHQKGLRLGFRLVERGGRTNRTCDLAIASAERVVHIERRIQYVDFEPEPSEGDSDELLPFPVEVVVDGLGRALLHGTTKLPDVKIFCYGNEVHYFVSYGSHPAFLRIDYGPPLRGGMIDLEYYGVSKNELEQHPQPDLDAVYRILRRLDFDCRVHRTRVEARYDKERALDLGDVCAKATALLRLLPHLMEVDWVIGSLRLSEDARVRVAEGWADFFVKWGILPFESFLTSDRTGILAGIEPGPAGGREVAWSGDGPYADFAGKPVDGAPLREHLRAALGSRGLHEEAIPIETIPDGPVGQLAIEASLIRPLCASIARGEILEGATGIMRRGEDLFRIDHEAERFAEILALRGNGVAESMRIARLILPLERSLRFRTSGSVNGYGVESAPIPLGRETGMISVLRDRAGMIRLALFSPGGVLHRSRRSKDAEWVRGGSSDPARAALMLRRRGYGILGPDAEPRGTEDPTSLCDEIARQQDVWARKNRPIPGERIVTGIAASPGRAAGPVVLGTEGRAPADLDGAILIAETIRPQDNACLYRAAGIVSTGGGILSHAGLLALQFRKPAVMISGRWESGKDGRRLVHRVIDFDEVESSAAGLRITMRRSLREHEEAILDGDLVVLDAGDATLRVLGQGEEPLALHHELRALAEVGRLLESASDDATILDLRGRRLRARHHLERLLSRMSDLVIARHAVREILLGETASGGGRGERTYLLSILLENPLVGDGARDHTAEVFGEMVGRHRSACEAARTLIPTSESEHEVLALRLEALRLGEVCEETAILLRECGSGGAVSGVEGTSPEIDALAARRLDVLRAEAIARCVEERGAARIDALTRHRLERIARIDKVLPDRDDSRGGKGRSTLLRIQERLERADSTSVARLGDRLILTREEGGIELASIVGSKAANLAEVERIAPDGLVPSWFVVTDRAFRLICDAPLGAGGPGEGERVTAGTMIDSILARDGTSDAQKAFLIRKLWEGLRIPDSIVTEIGRAYRDLARVAPDVEGEDRDGPLVAVRSSGTEEDTLIATRAGEFETFLFIRGERDLMMHVKRVFASFWTERAIHNRALLSGGRDQVRGGVLVQRIVKSRVSGVVQTINVAEGRMREIVVNAGLGMGEGIVSGKVGADLVVIRKEGIDGDASPRFRYVTNDKREKVVYDARHGSGTVLIETLYHERFRPALEYTELNELVRTARRLEAAFGIPLDIEFGIEGSSLRILQARPIPLAAAILRETDERYPMQSRRRQNDQA